jgi:hypothetical protein
MTANLERLFQGSSLTMTRAAGGSPIVIGNVYDVSETGKPANKIPIGSWEDTRVITRPGRPNFNDWTFGIRFNSDNAAQQALYACKGTGEECTFVLTSSEGTSKIKTFHARVQNWGFTGKQNDIYQGTLSLAGTDQQVRT